MSSSLGFFASQISGHLFTLTGSYDALATVTVPSGGASSITFSAIPQTGYKHLQIRLMVNGTSGTQDVYTQFNGDTGSNYSFHGLYGSGSTAAAYGSASQTKISTGVNLAGYGSGSAFSVGIIDLLDYSASTKYKTLRVPEVDAEKNLVTDSTFISLSDNGIRGNSSVYYKGYFGVDLTNSLLYKDASDRKEYVKSKMGKASNKFILGDYSINAVKEEDKFMNIKASFEVPDYSKKITDELYINLNLEKFFSGSSIIDTAKRKVGMENEYRYVIRQYTILDIPSNYKVTYLPKNFSVKDTLLGFSIQYTQQNGKVIAMQEMHNNYLLMQPKDFVQWNSTVRQILNQYKEQVVLQKQ